MSGWAGKRYWLVGATEGLGAALAQRISAAGAEVIVSGRNAARCAEVAEGLPGRAQGLPVDVQDSAAVREAAASLGQIDGVVFLAGVYWPMPAQETDAEQLIAMADVNFTGAARVLGAVLPGMVARDAGHIVLTGSLAGFRGLPGAMGYAASKAGVMNLAESLHADLWRTGIRVQLANPGFIRTRLTDRNAFHMPFLMTPEEAAQQMFELMCDENAFQRSFPRLFSYLFRLARLLPEWAFLRIFA
ncbi:MAG: SDR family NAD(P)-dependent oxidoreductase [Roseovarius sp.]|nr:SDR family NAD(P)-dependent oxidoreductase [Roseovarius sp.]